MSVAQVEKRWGTALFDPQKFKTSDISQKAAMAADLIKKNPFKNSTPAQVRERLGDWDGFYRFDSFPAYIIHDGLDTDTWQLVFLLDRHRRVTEIMMHRNGTPKF